MCCLAFAQLPAQTIRTLAGRGNDGGAQPARSAALVAPTSLAMDASGNLHIGEFISSYICKVDTDGLMTNFAGIGRASTSGRRDQFIGDGGPAAEAMIGTVPGLALDSAGNLCFSDPFYFRVRKIDSAGTVSTVVGNRINGLPGDQGPARESLFSGAAGLALDSEGNLYVADSRSFLVLKVSPQGTITTVAGGGNYPRNPSGLDRGPVGDGGPGDRARLCGPAAVAVDATGNLFIADRSNNRIRKVDPQGIITTVFGRGACDLSRYSSIFKSPSLMRSEACLILCDPVALVFDHAGSLLIAEQGKNRIVKLAADGTLSAVAGDISSSDGGPAAEAALTGPKGIATDGKGNFYIADSMGSRVRKVDANGIITTVAGTGVAGFSGDGGPAVAAGISNPLDVAVDGKGNLYIADGHNGRIRRVDENGIITTVAGDGSCCDTKDGVAATASRLNYPSGIAVDGAGNLYIADTRSNRIRKVGQDSVISTVAGNGAEGPCGRL